MVLHRRGARAEARVFAPQGAALVAALGVVLGASLEVPTGARARVSAVQRAGAPLKGPVTAAFTANGGYEVWRDGDLLMRSAAVPCRVHRNGAWCECVGSGVAASGGAACVLRPAGRPTTRTGTDTVGRFNRTELQWSDGSSVIFVTAIRVYDRPAAREDGVVVFEQGFPAGVSGSALPDHNTSSLCTAYPAWDTTAGFVGTTPAFVSWSGIGNGEAGVFPPVQQPAPLAERGRFGKAPAYHDQSTWLGGWSCSGVTPETPYGTSCSHPGSNLALFDRDQTTVLVFSALTQIDSVIQARQAGGPELRTGVMGSVGSIPPGHTFDSVVYIGARGVNAAFEGWGSTLLAAGGKERTKPDASIVLSHLSYSTTAGYFYSTEGAKGTYPNLIPGKTYEDTILDVAAYAQREKLPYRSILLDSWWYGEYSHNGSGMWSWDESSARETDGLDPNGRFPHGLAWLHDKLGGAEGMGTFIQHMGKWRGDTHYISNPAWDWRVDDRGKDNVWSTAWTDSQAFHESLFANATAWGLGTAKHDHVQEQMPLTTPAMEELGFLGRALGAELDALERHGRTMMAGGYTILGWLHGTAYKALTHARVASDYACWYNATTGVGAGCTRANGGGGNYWNWNVGPPALLSWAIGLYPYKDSFFSSSTAKGSGSCIAGSCLFANWSEPYPWVQAAASALSGGPVAPGDRVNESNRSIIMQTCREDGVLLRPDRPATPPDSYFSVRALGASALGPRGEVWTTETTVSGLKWMYAFGAHLDERYDLSLAELVASTERWSAAAPSRSGRHVAFDVARGPGSVRPLDDASALAFAPGPDYGTATLFTVAPVMSDGWALLGEVGKIISVSGDRFTAVQQQSGAPTKVTVEGAPGESVRVAALPPGARDPVVLTAVCGADGKATVVLKAPLSLSSLSLAPGSGKAGRKATPTWPSSANYSQSLVPLPQRLHQPPASVAPALSVGPEWVVAADVESVDGVFAANDLSDALVNITGGSGYSVLPFRAVSGQQGKFILFGTAGTPAGDAASRLLADRNVTLAMLGDHASSEAYVLAAADDAVVVLGAGPAGTFYGLQTVKQMWNASWVGCPPGGYCEVPSARVVDWPDLAVRGAHIHQLGDKSPSAVFYEQATRMAAHKMNFFSAMTTADIPFDLDREADFQLAMQRFCLERHMEYVPVVGLGTALMQDDRTGEGIWARSVPFVVAPDGTLTPATEPVLPLPNPGFEAVGPSGAPVNWTVLPQGKASSWSVDDNVSFSGRRSARLDIAPGSGLSSLLLSAPIAIEPARTYQMSAYLRVDSLSGDAPWIWLVQADKGGKEISGGSHLPTGAQATATGDEWRQVTCTFVAEPGAATFYVYAGLDGNTTGGGTRLWVDDVMVISLDHALSNVIRTTVTDLVVRPAGVPRNDTARLFRRGADYRVTDTRGVPPRLLSDFRAGAPAPNALNRSMTVTVTAVGDGRLKPGANVNVDYDFQPGPMGFHTYDLCDIDWSNNPAAAFTEPLYYSIAVNATLTLLDMFATRGTPVKYLNLDYDELRAVARDSRALLSGMTNGELVAQSINRISAAVKARYPNVTLLYWDDMLDPWHLHAPGSDQDNLQAQHYGREDGTLDTAMRLVTDKSTVWLNWFYDWPFSNTRINGSLAESWKLGFPTIGCPNEDFLNIECYSTVVRRSKLGLGLMDTDWDGKYIGVVKTASAAWHLVPNASLECDRTPYLPAP